MRVKVRGNSIGNGLSQTLEFPLLTDYSSQNEQVMAMTTLEEGSAIALSKSGTKRGQAEHASLFCHRNHDRLLCLKQEVCLTNPEIIAILSVIAIIRYGFLTS